MNMSAMARFVRYTLVAFLKLIKYLDIICLGFARPKHNVNIQGKGIIPVYCEEEIRTTII